MYFYYQELMLLAEVKLTIVNGPTPSIHPHPSFFIPFLVMQGIHLYDNAEATISLLSW